jgi:hypothetical protein
MVYFDRFEKMPLAMIDDEIASEVMAKLVEGEIVTGVTHEGWRYSHPLVLKTDYRIVIKTETATVGLSIATTDLYKELLTMKMPVPTETPSEPAKPRGRPPGIPNKPKDKPMQAGAQQYPYVPKPTKPGPFPDGSIWTEDTNKPGWGWLVPPNAQQPAPIQPQEKQEVPLAVAVGDEDWIVNSVDAMLDNLKAELQIFAEALVERGTPEPENKPLTCFDCVHCTDNGCSLFGLNVPWFVMQEPVGKCDKFDNVPF